jgi:hypothetical protein
VLQRSLIIKMNFIATIGTDLHIFSVKSTKWPWNLGQRSILKTFFNSLVMISYTLSILIFALKPIVKMLFSIEILIFHICTFGSIIRKISVIAVIKISRSPGAWGSIKIMWAPWIQLYRALKAPWKKILNYVAMFFLIYI